MKPKHRRLLGLFMALLGIGTGLWLLSQTLRSSIVYYWTPSELYTFQPSPNQTVRLGGQVVRYSTRYENQAHHFAVSDGTQTAHVQFSGLLPTLFREGQGVVAEGHWHPPFFQATRLLVKHDEYYSPPTLAKQPKS